MDGPKKGRPKSSAQSDKHRESLTKNATDFPEERKKKGSALAMKPLALRVDVHEGGGGVQGQEVVPERAAKTWG